MHSYLCITPMIVRSEIMAILKFPFWCQATSVSAMLSVFQSRVRDVELLSFGFHFMLGFTGFPIILS